MKGILIIVLISLLFACNSGTEQREDKASSPGGSGLAISADEEPGYGELALRVGNYLEKEYLSEADLRAIADEQREFQLQTIDLNGDGEKEIFIHLVSSYFCGTGGCTLLLLDHQLGLITEFTVTRTPLYVDQTKTRGWSDVWTQSEGKWRKLTYQQDAYPGNPSLVEASGEGPGKNADLLFEDEQQEQTYRF